MLPYYPIFINGEFKESKRRQAVINPANSEVIAETAIAENSDLRSALESARKAADQGEWPNLPLSKRKEFILKISQGILERAGELARLETINTGKPIKESTFMDIPSSAQVFEYFAHNLEALLAEEKLEISTPIAQAHARLVRQPLGVALLIVPWNYPLLIASWKLAQALAAGNSVILKPSSLTPLTVLELAKIVQAAGLPKGAVNIIQASGQQVGETLCADKRLDLISFTGSNAVGRQIVSYAGENVKKLLMELGGKSASLVLKDADLESAVSGSLCSIFLNQGQMCTAMSRIFVAEEIFDKFLGNFLANLKRIKLGDGMDYQAQMGPLISQAQREKVISAIEKAKRQGAKLLCGGKIPDAPELKKGFFFEPAVFTDVTPQMEIFREEIFGPVACINKFSSPEEAVALANTSEFGLANCIWSKNTALAQELALKINSGFTWVNTYGMFFPQLPYGGFKQSGFGKELGREGFLEYTRLKNILVDQAKDTKPLVSYWYGG